MSDDIEEWIFNGKLTDEMVRDIRKPTKDKPIFISEERLKEFLFSEMDRNIAKDIIENE